MVIETPTQVVVLLIRKQINKYKYKRPFEGHAVPQQNEETESDFGAAAAAALVNRTAPLGLLRLHVSRSLSHATEGVISDYGQRKDEQKNQK